MAMLQLLSIFVLLSLSYAQYTARCGLPSELGTTLNKSTDAVDGRFIVEWCSKLAEEATEWNFDLKYIDYHNGTDKCLQGDSVAAKIQMEQYLRIHSVFSEKLLRPFLDCNITCLSKPLDLVFSGCYVALSQLKRGQRTWRRHSTTLRVVEPGHFDSAEAFNRIHPFYEIEYETGNTLRVKWNLHYIPVKQYVIKIVSYDNNNETLVTKEWKNIEENCTHELFAISCPLPAPALGRCVAASLEHNAPWKRGTLFNDFNVMRYCTKKQLSETLSRTDARVWWAAGVLALVLTALAACWAAHARVLADVRKRVLQEWTRRYSSYASARAPAAASDGGHILLLYARDCAPAMDAVAIVKEMLEDGAPGRVYDIFAPECVSLYAASPPEWLRGVLARPDVKVVLVQTPAAAALYGAQQDEESMHLQEPLLGSRVQYRCPHYGDALLQFALRLVRDTAHMQHEYTKYYIAYISDLQSDMLPQVASYRRYVLPAHAPLLLNDLRLPCDADATRKRLARLAPAVDKLLDYVRGNENYLKDELMFL